MLGKLLILDNVPEVVNMWLNRHLIKVDSLSMKAEMPSACSILVSYQNTRVASLRKEESVILDKQTSKSLFQV